MQEHESPIMKRDLVEVLFSDDALTAYIKLVKPLEGEEAPTKEDIAAALAKANVVCGIKEEMVEKLAARPIYGIKIEVVHAIPPTYGEDGSVFFLIKQDTDFKPEYNEEGNIDYKNINHFQIVKKDQPLCQIIPEKPGIPGKNVFGLEVPAKSGKRPSCPSGKNVYISDEGTMLRAAVEGVVHFTRDQIEVNDTMNIRSNVNNVTGNIHFPGDVIIEGDVCDGFSVECGGDLIIKGVVEAAKVESGGNLHVSKGVNGGGRADITVGKDFFSQYVEGSVITVHGSIFADYIASCDVTCDGNIELKGKRELILGGDVKLVGDLIAKDIGNERELPTRVEILRVEIDNSEIISKMETERKTFMDNLLVLRDAAKKYEALLDANPGQTNENFDLIRKQVAVLMEKIELLDVKIRKEKNNPGFEFRGSVICKRKLFQGASIHFADQKFRFTFDNLEHCRIYWNEGEIVQANL